MAGAFDPRKYARPERERRFLLDGVPDGLGPSVHILDRYLEGTRMRLRRVDGPDGSVVGKLGQKVRTDPHDPAEVWITNLYLDEDEYDRLVGLPAAVLEKSRHPWPRSGVRSTSSPGPWPASCSRRSSAPTRSPSVRSPRRPGAGRRHP